MNLVSFSLDLVDCWLLRCQNNLLKESLVKTFLDSFYVGKWDFCAKERQKENKARKKYRMNTKWPTGMASIEISTFSYLLRSHYKHRNWVKFMVMHDKNGNENTVFH